jgi:hypothetical protein
VSEESRAEIQVVSTWRRVNIPDSFPVANGEDYGKLVYHKILQRGSLPDEADEYWASSGTIPAGNSIALELSALPDLVFGDDAIRSFGCLKHLHVINESTATGATLQIGGSPSNTLLGIFADPSDAVIIGPDGVMSWGGPRGIEVTAGSADTLRLRATGVADVDYVVVIVGCVSGIDLMSTPNPDAGSSASFAWGPSNYYDTDQCGDSPYTVAKDRWDFSFSLSWDNMRPKKFNTPACDPLVDNSVVTGLPTGRTRYESILDRQLDVTRAGYDPNLLVGPYITLVQVATEDCLQQDLPNGGCVWPRSRPILDSTWASSPEAESGLLLGVRADRPVGATEPWADSGVGSRWIDVTEPAACTLMADQMAVHIQNVKELHPRVNIVLTDNFAAILGNWDDNFSPTANTSEDAVFEGDMDVAGKLITQISPLGVALLANITLAGFTGDSVGGPGSGASGKSLAGFWDMAETAGGIGLMGIYVEGLSSGITVRSSHWNTICANIKNWLARPWPFGGRRMLLTQAALALEDDPDPTVVKTGFARRVRIMGIASFDANNIRVTTLTPHYVADTSLPTVAITGVDGFPPPPALPFNVTHVSEFVFNMEIPGHGLGPFTLDTPTISYARFIFAGYDTDFGMVHSLRNTGDSTLNFFNPDSNFEPLWADDYATYGQVLAPPTVVSTHTVNVYNGVDPGGVPISMVKRIKYQFGQGPIGERWHYVDFSITERRRWKAAS